MDAVLKKIYSNVAEENIMLFFCLMPNKKGCVLGYNDNYAIAINYRYIKTEREEKQVLAEELAHCLTKTLYPVSALATLYKDKEIERAEKYAQDYASTLLIPLETLFPLLDLPYYNIAEELDVEEKMVIRAIEYYQRKGMLNEY